MNRRQRQQAGAGSHQIQVAGDLVVGITEERAVEIAREQSRIAIEEFTAEATAEANARMDSFDEKVVNDLSRDGLLGAFADPAFQILLRKTQLHAASTPESADHELLSKLLTERAAKPAKPIHMVVTRAVEVVEQIDADALTGLTSLWFVTSVAPTDVNPKSGLATIDALAAKLFSGSELPAEPSWLQRLDLMNCINRSSASIVQTLMKWQDIFLRNRPGYVCEGIAADDVDAFRAKLNRVLPGLSSLIVEHPFIPGRFRLNSQSSEQLLNFLTVPLSLVSRAKDQLPNDALQTQFALGSLRTRSDLEAVIHEAKLDVVSAEATANLLQYVDSDLQSLSRLRSWWDGIQGLTEITPIGVAIGYSNAKRVDPLAGFPALPALLNIP